MTKDRLPALRAARQDLEDDDFCEVSLIIMEEDRGMEDFLAEVDEIKGDLQKLQNDIEAVKETQDNILACPGTDERLRNLLDILTATIKRTFDKTGHNLKVIQLKTQQVESITETDLRIRTTQHGVLTRKFVVLMTEYNEIQLGFKDKCESRIGRQKQIAGIVATEEEIEEFLKSGNLSLFTQDVIADERQARETLSDIQARHSDILKLETSIQELHSLFVDMAVMMDTQGEMMDIIEYHVNSAMEKVADATQDVIMAQQYHRRSRKKKLMILICLAVGGIVGLSVAMNIAGL